MWFRKDLKERAKKVLKQSYWRALAISFIIVITGGSLMPFGAFSHPDNQNDSNANNSYTVDFPINEFERHFRFDNWSTGKDTPFLTPPDTSNWPSKSLFDMIINLISVPTLIVMGAFAIITALFTILFRVLIGYNIEVGGRRYFLLAAQGDEQMANAFNNIKSRYFINIICTMFLRSVYTFLWSLLFVIPGIVKSYAYRMVPYILAEHPDMPPSHAIALSCQITNGHKFNMFVLDLSFMGWYFLGSMAFGIGRYFVNPYVESTYAQLYLALNNPGGTYYNDEDDYIDVRETN